MKLWSRFKFPPTSVSIKSLFITSYLLQLLVTMGLVGYLSFRNWQENVADLAGQIQTELGEKVAIKLDSYLSLAHQLNEINLHTINQGLFQLDDLDVAGQYFWKQAQIFPQISFIGYYLKDKSGAGAGRWLAGEEGIVLTYHPPNQLRDYTYGSDDQGRPTELLYEFDYDDTVHLGHMDAVRANKPTWSKIYFIEDLDGYVSASANTIIRDDQDRYIGVLGVDILLNQISDFLRSLSKEFNGNILIVERNGDLVASSSPEFPVFENVITPDTGQADVVRFNISNYQDPFIQSLSQVLTTKVGTIDTIHERQQFTFSFENQQQFSYLQPWQDQYGLDWMILVTIPRSSLTAQIDERTADLVTISLFIGALSVAFGFQASQWLTKPIQKLENTATQIAQNTLEEPEKHQDLLEFGGSLEEEVSIFNEVQTLEKTLVAMGSTILENFEALRQAEALQKNYNQQLEAQVRERTQALDLALTKAEAANLAKSEFLSNISHEIRTPITAILGFSQMLAGEIENPEHQECLEIIHRSGQNLLNLINDVLDLSKIEAGHFAVEYAWLSVQELLEEIQKLFQIQAQSRGVALEYDLAEDFPFAIAFDEIRLRQLLINLVGNGLKFTHQGRVTIRIWAIAEEDPNFITMGVAVEDTGIGIPQDQIQEIVKPFVQQKGQSQKKYGGTGLGLAIVFKVTQLLKGTMDIESVEGEGSCFRFLFPHVEVLSDEPATTKGDENLADLGQVPPLKIMMVDDVSSNRQLFRHWFRQTHHEVFIFERGDKFLAEVKRICPDLLVVDWHMPVVSGLDIARSLKKNPATAHLPIVMMTASGVDLPPEFQEHFQALLQKPVTSAQFVAVLETLFGDR